jgi:hypothetical protein
LLKALVATAAVTAILIGAGGPTPGSALPQASLTLPKTTYLSTESVSGSLTIHNTTATSLSYNPVSVSFLIRGQDGNVREQRWITSISRPISSTLIAPGKRRTFRIPLPTCDVVADPCSERVALEVSLDKPDRSWLRLVTAESSYAFVADPTATYRAGGLSGNRPLFITQADATRSVLQRMLVVTFQIVASPQAYQTSPDEAASIGEIFKRRGLSVGGSGFTTNAAGFTTFVVLRDQDASASVDSAIGDVLSNQTKAKLISKSFRPDEFDVFPIQTIAHAGARREAQRLAEFVGGAGVSETEGPELGEPPQLAFARTDGETESEFTPVDLSGFGEYGGESMAAATKGLLDIRATDTAAFTGAVVASGPPLPPVGAERTEYFGTGATRITGLPLRALTEADRPEVFAAAETTTQAADRRGFLASGVATSLAAAAARTLARELGVSAAGPLTLVAAYPEYDYSPQLTIETVGVAIAPAGDLDAGWRSMLSPPKRVLPFRLIPVPTPTPTPTPLSLPLTAQTPQPNYSTPIDIPDDPTQLVARGDVPNQSRPDSLELSVAVSRRTPDGSRLLPAPSDVELAVRALPSVASVAVQRPDANGPPGYTVTIDGDDPSNVTRAADRIRRMYGYSDVVLKYHVAPVSKDCGTLIEKAQRSSLTQALKAAIAEAEAFDTPLRHLVLAVATPASFNSDDACASVAEYPLDTATDAALTIPSEPLTVHAPVRLVFRTRATAH